MNTTIPPSTSVVPEHLQYTLELVFGGLGTAIQLFNCIWAASVLFRRPNPYNGTLVICGVFYLLAQGIVVTQTIISFSGGKNHEYLTMLEDLGQGEEVKQQYSDWKLGVIMPWLQRTYNFVYGVATLVYVLIVQIRFRVVRRIVPYWKGWDHIFVGFTVILWAATFLTWNVIHYSRDGLSSGISAAVWNIYVLVVDQLLCVLFLMRLKMFQRKFGQSIRRQTARRTVFVALICLAIMSWVAFGVFMYSNMGYRHDEGMRNVLFRVASALSGFMMSAALLFIYTVKTMMTGSTTSQLSRSKGSGGTELEPSSALRIPRKPEAALTDATERLHAVEGQVTYGFAKQPTLKWAKSYETITTASVQSDAAYDARQ
ncbi:uncharacterized protein SPPG_01757 [Spizellomyces punctatus DAOM BR117]|uniref:G-protein coupled receptors family 3 profile domain-containing protein n=1 Tax=Spizellomyces punctatus (strain DAOM BR117) TaxID=645134 RepID=A0A0L0HNM0_SPIPD|nr:uncharacterized protein SPPG_01757 [Spizellomyces punctatus DAOM BR117]KND02672.1 hypothetical protein SPPG_01757 [Spizellomyces punctatus DAOM BR117]|eukprot:XP_016610711.1 hypothetical protein SPPG_01757 [Spizellomyces punctatus DAOM BR117]